MKYLHDLEYIKGLTNKPGTPDPFKRAIQSESEGGLSNQGSFSDSETADLKAELQHFSPEEKETLICEQVAAINRLVKSNSELQTANEQLAFTLAEKTKQWMALQP
jgi:hypothetical protein